MGQIRDAGQTDLTTIREIVSGGQTGVDQAALQVAIELSMSHGGWCPRGRRCETGLIPSQYQLTESHSWNYRVRTEQNVVDSDATLIFFRQTLSGGTAYTLRLALKHARPLLKVDLAQAPDAAAVRAWAQQHQVRRLNVAGPRQSTAPGIYEQAHEFLQAVFRS